MVDESEADAALEFLRKSAEMVKPLALQSRQKAHKLKYIEALLVKEQSEKDIPVTLRKDYARADDRYDHAGNEEAEAWAEWISLQERRDTAKTAISLYQSQVKDRL